MDYEKAYKVVLKTATQWIKDGCTDKEKICLECVFPELSESEDERIRKDLIYDIERLPMQGVLTHRPTSEYIAYLEKQKEQKPKNILTNDDSLQTAYLKGQTDVIEDPEAYGLQKEQKSADWSEKDEKIRKALVWHLKADVDFVSNGVTKAECLAYLDKQKAQKSEWSEEDEKMRNLAIEWAETMSGQCNFIGMDSTDFRKIVAWLKSLRPQPKQEWSEEDIYITNILEYIVGKHRPNEIFKIGNKQGVSAYKICSWLKSLRPCPSWKPSEEQMDSLRDTIVQTKGYSYSMYLPELYEQLKNL